MRREVHDQTAEAARDAAQQVVDYYQRYFMKLEVEGQLRPDVMVRHYDLVRSMRDRISDVVRQKHPKIELDRDDSNLLVSCCVFCLDSILTPLKECVAGTRKQVELQNRARMLFTIATEFAQNPVELIDRPDRVEAVSPDQRRIVDAINTKVITGERKVPPIIGRLMPLGPGDTSASPRPKKPPSDWDDIKATRVESKSYESRLEDDAIRRNPLPNVPDDMINRSTAPGFEAGACVKFNELDEPREDNFIPVDDGFGSPASAIPEGFDPFGDDPFTTEDDPFADEFFARDQAPPPPRAAPKPPPQKPPAQKPPAPKAPQRRPARPAVTPQQPAKPFALVAPSFIRDHRLRSMIELDQKGLGIAVAEGDTRLAAVLLCSIFEAVVLDLTLHRADQLGLRGTPDTWDLRRILLDFLDEAGLIQDKSILTHVLTSRNLVHPAAQLANLVIVNRQALVKMIDSVQRFVACYGLSPANA